MICHGSKPAISGRFSETECNCNRHVEEQCTYNYQPSMQINNILNSEHQWYTLALFAIQLSSTSFASLYKQLNFNLFKPSYNLQAQLYNKGNIHDNQCFFITARKQCIFFKCQMIQISYSFSWLKHSK